MAVWNNARTGDAIARKERMLVGVRVFGWVQETKCRHARAWERK
jgi:hypothetical protein